MKLRLLPLLVLAPFLLLAPWATVGAGGLVSKKVTSEPALTPSSASASRLEARRNYIVRAVERVKGAVVNIHSERTVHGPASAEMLSMNPPQNRVNGMGTGIIIDQRGYIVTNYHVVEGVSVIRIRLANGITTDASIVARSRKIDLALLKIDTTKPLPTIPLGTAKDLMVGEDVVAIGNAFGYEHTVSRGIVSAVNRDVSLNKEISYRSLIQTDASINPGNSGGPLVNIHGELIGVNVAIRAGAQGIGFAIPSDKMIEFVGEMLRNRRLQIANEGMTVHDRLTYTPGGAIRSVRISTINKDGPAFTAGLQSGDVVTKVADLPVKCSYDVDRALLGRRPGDRVTVVVNRNGKSVATKLILSGNTRTGPGIASLVWQKLGLRMAPVSKVDVTRVNGQLKGGMRVTTLQSNSASERAGIQQGDILVGLHRWETISIDNIAFVLQHPDFASFNPLEFYIIRGGQVRRGWLQQVD